MSGARAALVEWLTSKAHAHDSAAIDQPGRKAEHEGAARAFREASAYTADHAPTPPALDAEEKVTLYRAAAMNGEERRLGPWSTDESAVAHLGEEVQQADFVPVGSAGLDAEDRERLAAIAGRILELDEYDAGEYISGAEDAAVLLRLASHQPEPTDLKEEP